MEIRSFGAVAHCALIVRDAGARTLSAGPGAVKIGEGFREGDGKRTKAAAAVHPSRQRVALPQDGVE
ncbi:hypothetical protein D1F64_05100 [Breoghania sp. L-A4]|nr:hypothetical protein D1F64_05100 [Breoghania sp. L-A4]